MLWARGSKFETSIMKSMQNLNRVQSGGDSAIGVGTNGQKSVIQK